VSCHLIAGAAYGLKAAARTHSPLFYAHLDMVPDAVAGIPTDQPERAVYVARGAIELDGETYGAGKMMILDGQASQLRAKIAVSC